MSDVTDAVVARLKSALHQEGWGEPYMARVASFTREQILAGELKAADLEADRLNSEALSRALAFAFGDEKGDVDV
ncbi:hypothetical protein [Frankia sp. AgW1.1]|uniref:hypothetical protein n=1 Tax=Frankia sp. AgW1.1 TaxID=1836971 RepID=UPI0019323D22|nr:hypothetical protein [Frankia sp. AgW1.1]MBL7487115.1 hypothetical protein [Frankia sp. AgW1.1]